MLSIFFRLNIGTSYCTRYNNPLAAPLPEVSTNVALQVRPHAVCGTDDTNCRVFCTTCPVSWLSSMPWCGLSIPRQYPLNPRNLKGPSDGNLIVLVNFRVIFILRNVTPIVPLLSRPSRDQCILSGTLADEAEPFALQSGPAYVALTELQPEILSHVTAHSKRGRAL